MFFNINEFHKAYDKILKQSGSHSSCQLVIFVSCLNIDSLCVTKMLANLFKKQLIQLQLIPVFGYSDLKEHFIKLDENINSVIFVGCGGMIDLESFLEIGDNNVETEKEVEKQRRDVYVFDSHRPWNLDNLFGSQMIVCFDDGTVDGSLEKQRNAYYKLIELEGKNKEHVSSSESSDEADTLCALQSDEEDGSTKKRRLNENQDTINQKKVKKKDLHIYESIIEEYYSQGTTISTSLSVQVYSLISSIGETNLNYLWLAIVGVSSLEDSYPQVYQGLVGLLRDEVKRLSPNEKTKTPDTLSIEIQPDYCLFLLRHSSLYDSFYYSNHVNAKMSIWNENGKKRLHKMFARMGIPLNTAHESWLYLDNRIKRELSVIFDKNLERYGLQNIVRDGFIRTFGYHGSISASEFVESITSLLEVGNHDKQVETIIYEASKNELDLNEMLLKRKKRWLTNFWSSWDALDDNIEFLKQGIIHAQFLQKSIFNTGVTILEKKMIKHLRIYRLCVLHDTPDLHLYKNPLTLLRLGNWLIEYLAESDHKQLLPMVLASLDDITDTYLVAGLASRYPHGIDILDYHKPILNNFSIAFQYIANQTGAKVRIDNFESSIIEIKKEDFQPFLEKLTLSGLL